MNKGIDPKDLRIGNYVEFQLGLTEIFAIGSKRATIQEGKMEFEWLKPIPLTEEWLLEFGFKESNGIWWNRIGVDNLINISFSDDYCDFIISFRMGAIQIKIKYIHQLQNVVYALTGEELTLKLEDNE